MVSGSVDQQKKFDSDLVTNGIQKKRLIPSPLSVPDGESRDSTTVGGVSSSDGRRKRTANEFESSEAKRQRESPNEAVTSSETRQQANRMSFSIRLLVTAVPEHVFFQSRKFLNLTMMTMF